MIQPLLVEENNRFHGFYLQGTGNRTAFRLYLTRFKFYILPVYNKTFEGFK